VDAVDTFLSTYPASAVVLDVLGTLDAEEIRARVRELEPTTEEIFHFGCSVGATFGVRLEDGSQIALKLHRLFDDREYFRAVQRVQAALRRDGFPAPRPIRAGRASPSRSGSKTARSSTRTTSGFAAQWPRCSGGSWKSRPRAA
jgi:hypothetical protein